MAPKSDALCVSHLTVQYEKQLVVWDIDLSIPQGKLVGILGPNGAGKSTFLKALLGLVKTVSGAVFFFEKRMHKMRQHIAYVPQKELVDWTFPITVKDLVLMGRTPKKGLFSFMTNHDYEIAEKALLQVGMEQFSERQISELSGGQQQRVFLARALAQEADLYFLDEPFSGVDHYSEGIIISLLKKMRDEGKTIFVVHHDLNSVDAYFDWLILMNTRLVKAGPKEEVFTAQYMKEAYGKGTLLYDTLFSQKKV